MKRIVSLIAVTVLTIALTACGGNSQAAATDAQAAENDAQAVTESQEEAAEDQAAAEPEAKHEETTQETEAAAEEAAAETDNQGQAPAAHSDVLVAYFSATGTTKGVAERIASVTGGDLYEIQAADPYTEDDLNYNDDNSRSTKEQNDKSVRPEIGSEEISLEGYTTIYLGFPIWWGEEPRIMDTFVESYDFSGKTMIPFCTSASSGIGSSGDNLKANAGNGEWTEGRRFSADVSQAEMEEWVNSL